MMLNKLIMKNFRSYDSAEICLPPGTSLFEGDIGSGKSSILYAIEFALFGLGDMKGESLLRAGKQDGSVELSFTINGREFHIQRSLSRKGTNISQNQGYIIEEKRKYDMAPTEMRARILDILSFNESLRTRSSSVIFRYAIFTPQEEMKEILRLKAEDRLQTLRKAFGLEDYKNARDNAKLLSDGIKMNMKFIDGELSDFDSLVLQRKESETNLSATKTKLNTFNQKKSLIESEYSELEKEFKELESVMRGYDKHAAQIPILIKELEAKNGDLKYTIADTETLTSDMLRIEKMINEISSERAPSEKRSAELEQDAKSMEKELSVRSESAYSAKSRLMNIRELLDKKICPTCRTELDPANYQGEIEILEKGYASAESEAKKIRQNMESTRDLVKKQEDYERKQNEKQRLLMDKERTMKRIEANSSRVGELNARIGELESEIPRLEQETAKSKELKERMENITKKKSESEEKIRFIISRTGSLSGEIKTLEESITRMASQISAKIEHKKKREVLVQYHSWLCDYFIPCVEKIEKHVLASINSEFNSLFVKWFSMLLEGSEISVRADESFTPVVEQNGYEMSIDSLSGGEKTSVAFSYRLALNLMVRKVCTSMQSNLLILDEPTDGFSKEQLFKVRDVLDELNCDQVVLVSHERELEGFVDNIFYVEKKAGLSSIREK